MKKISLILACFNDELSIKESTKRIINILDITKYEYELIFIDDASEDNSSKIISNVQNHHHSKNILSIFHTENIGRGGTVKEGILKAKGDIVGFVDIDLEVSENYLPAFIRAIDLGADVAIGSRSYKFQITGPHRYLGSVIYPILVRRLLLLPFKDTEAGYKFFNRKKILPIVKKTEDNGWFWDTEIIARAFFANLKIVEIPILFQRRPEKKSTVKFMRDSWRQLQRLLIFKGSLK